MSTHPDPSRAAPQPTVPERPRRRATRLALPLLAVGLSIGATIAGAAPADAHVDRIFVPGGGGSAAVSNNHMRIQACDTSGDGTPIQAQFITQGWGFGRVFDTHATTRGRCTEEAPGREIVWFRVCKLYTCSTWRPVA